MARQPDDFPTIPDQKELETISIQGYIFKEIIDKARNIFKDVKIFKPKSSRKESKENYIICKNLK